MKFIVLFLFLLSAMPVCFGPVCFAQTVTDQKEAVRLYKQSKEDSRISKLYYAEIDKCRLLLKMGSYADAEGTCAKAVTIAEKFPTGRNLEKSNARMYQGIAQLRQSRPDEAIANFEKARIIANRSADDADLGDNYFLVGQAHHMAGRIDKAREFYNKAESTIRTAFKQIEDDEIRSFYPMRIQNILKAHIALLRDNDLKDEAAEMEKRLDEFKKEFARYLEDEITAHIDLRL